MEFFYLCITCSYYRRNEPPGTPSLPDQIRWCVRHERKLPPEVGKEHLICCNYKPYDPRAIDWENVIAKLPIGELWTFELYRPSRKFAVISELPQVNPDTGEVISS